MDDKTQNNNSLEDLFLRYLNDELNKDELRSLDEYLGKNAEKQAEFEAFRKAWFLSGLLKKGTSNQSSTAFKRFQNKIISYSLNKENKKIIRIIRYSLKIAGIVIFTFLATITALYFIERGFSEQYTQAKLTETIVPKGAKAEVILPDGTEVWLNADSKLSYGVNFGKLNREVNLEGEGYFKVAHNSRNKFIVHAQDLAITALGTEFNVKAYPEENMVEALLVEGKITVDSKKIKSQQVVSLVPNQCLVYQKKSRRMVVVTDSEIHKNEKLNTPPLQKKPAHVEQIIAKFDPKAITSWKDDNWVIDQEKLSDLAIKLERKYDVNIKFKDASLKNFRFTGTLKDESLEQVLRVIALTSPIVYEIDGKNVLFKEDKAKKKQYKEIYNLN